MDAASFCTSKHVETADEVLETTKMTSDLLERLILTNNRFPVQPSQVTRFHARSVPDISVEKYIRRILKYSPFPSVCLITVLVYIDRLATRNPNFVINSFNIHRVIITALTIAVKFHCDHLYTNRHYANVGGIAPRELMYLEFDMLSYLNYEIVVQPEEIDLYNARLLALHMQNQSSVNVVPSQQLLVKPMPSRVPTPVLVTDTFQAPYIHTANSSANSSSASLNKRGRYGSFSDIPIFINTKNAISAFFARDVANKRHDLPGGGARGSVSNPTSTVPSPLLNNPHRRHQSVQLNKAPRVRRSTRGKSLPTSDNFDVYQ